MLNSRKLLTGFTLLELLVATAIIILLTALILPNYRAGDKQLALQISASKLAQDLRRSQEMAMSAKEVSGKVPYGLGLYFIQFFNQATRSYILFADLNDDKAYSGGSEAIETISLEKQIKISALSPTSWAGLTIVFSPPDPTVWINGLSSGVTAQITLGIIDDLISSQIISVNNAGLIFIE